MNDSYSESPGIDTASQPLTVPLVGFSESRGPMRTLVRALQIAQETSGTVKFVCARTRAEHTLDDSFLSLIGWIAEHSVMSAEVHIDAPLEEAIVVRRRLQELFGA